MITYNFLSVHDVLLFLTFSGVLTFSFLVTRIIGMLREQKPMITYTACQSLPSRMQSPGMLDIQVNGEIWGRVFPDKGGYALTAKPDKYGAWQIKRHIMLDLEGTKELIAKLATN